MVAAAAAAAGSAARRRSSSGGGDEVFTASPLALARAAGASSPAFSARLSALPAASPYAYSAGAGSARAA
jgi:hypothetical protein